MARNIINDKLMSHQFHLLDVDFSMSVPPFVLTPAAGFSAITAPEIQIATEEITEGTDPFVHHILGKATANTITLQRGVSAFNSDFWRWMSACLLGNKPDNGTVLGFLKDVVTLQGPKIPGKRRDMLLLHFTDMSPGGFFEAISSADGAGDILRAGVLAGVQGAAAGAFLGLQTLSDLTSGLGGFLDLGVVNVPGKAYMLFGCLPTRYKPASDFDANASEISLEELDLNFHRFEEFSISG